MTIAFSWSSCWLQYYDKKIEILSSKGSYVLLNSPHMTSSHIIHMACLSRLLDVKIIFWGEMIYDACSPSVKIGDTSWYVRK